MTGPPRYAGSSTIGVVHKFVLLVGTQNLGDWSKVAGLSVTWDIADHRIGNSDQYMKYLGIPKFEKLKLSRAADGVGTPKVKTWLEKVAASSGTVPESGTLKLYTPAATTPVTTWTLKELFPYKWQITEFDASASKVAIETLELVYSGFLTRTWKV